MADLKSFVKKKWVNEVAAKAVDIGDQKNRKNNNGSFTSKNQSRKADFDPSKFKNKTG